MRIYLASFFNTKERLLPYRDRLLQQGHFVTSTWLEEPPNPAAKLGDYSLEDLETWANRDIREILSSDLLIIDTFDETPRGGREVEMGYAMGLGLLVYRVGPARNLFHYLVDRNFDTWEECLTFLFLEGIGRRIV